MGGNCTGMKGTEDSEMEEPWLSGSPPPLGSSPGVCQRNPQVCGPGRCIPRPRGYTCACDSGFRLSPQGTHCIGESGSGGGRRRGGRGSASRFLTSPVHALRRGRVSPRAPALCPRAL